MNADFLIKYRQQPRREFARALYTRIDRPAREWFRAILLRRVALGLTALLFALALTLAVSPAARAYLAAFVREIGGLTFEEWDTYPGGGPVEVVLNEVLTLEDVRLGRPFPISLPVWVPEGTVPRDEVIVDPFMEGYTPVTITWVDEETHTAFDLTVAQYEVVWAVGPESAEEVLVNGQPAALVYGAWNADRQEWDEGLFTTLMWKIGEQVYSLQSNTLDAEILIRIAESIPAP